MLLSIENQIMRFFELQSPEYLYFIVGLLLGGLIGIVSFMIGYNMSHPDDSDRPIRKKRKRGERENEYISTRK